ncbi:FUSC family protein [Sinomonas sp. JGH33]|uniref:FUSC family protein n=1 Tax=Sinomonas terricola TaxID=3110330 RepID=A0ABU5T6P6_9MICC|nr:FUSC family protein [Sinomonas sp. JGH33]MEA5454806.1 FUSC family protein [Sinomonas sp. JGH33]
METPAHGAPDQAKQDRAHLAGLPSLARERARAGWARTRASLLPALLMTVGAVVAYLIAYYLLGHVGPIFAATSALISLGFGRDLTVRKVLEVAVGCTLGIVLGDLMVTVFGAGIWQAGVVLMISLLVARFLDRGVIFATQLGIQSLFVVLLPAPVGGPFTRSLDAVVGGLVSLLITALLPRDPRVQPRDDLEKLVAAFSEMLRECAEALAESDSTRAWHALVRGRGSQGLVDTIRATLKTSGEVTRIAPAYRRYRGEIEDFARAVEYLDLALRNGRVVARRLTSTINNAALSERAAEGIAGLLSDTAESLDLVAAGLSTWDRESRRINLRSAGLMLEDIASRAHPRKLHVERLEGEALVILIRPMLVDLLEATGYDHEDAVALLPGL